MQAFHMYLAMVFIVLAIAAPIQPVTSRPQLAKRSDQSELEKYARMEKTFTLPELPYANDALEPSLSRDIMIPHHDKHHKAYVDNLNKAIKDLKTAIQRNDMKAARDLLPVLKFNLGGHVNHKMFWKFLQPQPGRDKEGYRGNGGIIPSPDTTPLIKAILKKWGCMEKFKDEFNEKASKIQGSGWAWLVIVKESGDLKVVTTKDQEMAWDVHPGVRVVFGVDVWEHAYYLQYKNVRMDYLKAIWNVVNWGELARRYEEAVKGQAKCPKGHDKH